MYFELSLKPLVFIVLINIAFLGLTLQVLAQRADEPAFFSGPQEGEAFAPFKVRKVFEPGNGTEFDPTRPEEYGKFQDSKSTSAPDKPVLVVFIHDVNRQTIAMTRTLTAYAAKRNAELDTCVVLLDDDVAKGQQTLERIRHALTDRIVTAVSLDGLEGPGVYGLNRKSSLTILLGKKGKVLANFALIQPSLQSDLVPVVKSIVEAVGGELPALQQMLEDGNPGMKQEPNAAERAFNAEIRAIVSPLIKKDAADNEVDAAAKVIQDRMESDPAVKREIHRIATTIVSNQKLANYGTARCQEYLMRWASDAKGK